ncbi:hypothetical protein ANSO36C_59980 [Nostoc cf. commune SO-36]|uniref:Uncharacterized protein n=1 Tax=Nostoc cf. commune SO-36 TaxID=449208 RepID=A0ABM7ZAC8_NOSCO|nr:hypothetical protein ANSO36C_59980 [Nostoc cf. commune SO-36]
MEKELGKKTEKSGASGLNTLPKLPQLTSSFPPKAARSVTKNVAAFTGNGRTVIIAVIAGRYFTDDLNNLLISNATRIPP